MFVNISPVINYVGERGGNFKENALSFQSYMYKCTHNHNSLRK